jgi:hypothetical protein
VLDFVQPQRARWRLVSFGGQAGRNEAGGQNARMQALGGVQIANWPSSMSR